MMPHLARHFIEEYTHGDIYRKGLRSLFPDDVVLHSQPLPCTRALVNFLTESAAAQLVRLLRRERAAADDGEHQRRRATAARSTISTMRCGSTTRTPNKVIDSFIAHTHADQKLGHENVFLEMCQSIPPLTRARGQRRAERRALDGRAPAAVHGRHRHVLRERFRSRAAPARATCSPSRATSRCGRRRQPRLTSRYDRSRLLERLRERAAGRSRPEDIRRVLDGYRLPGRLAGRLPRSSRCARRCTRSASPASTRRSSPTACSSCCSRRSSGALLAIHRRDPVSGEECGHCVALLLGRRRQGRLVRQVELSRARPSRRRSSPTRRQSRPATPQAYVEMGFQPLYFGVTTLEEAAPDIDWRFHPDALNVLSERIQASYAVRFRGSGD